MRRVQRSSILCVLFLVACGGTQMRPLAAVEAPIVPDVESPLSHARASLEAPMPEAEEVSWSAPDVARVEDTFSQDELRVLPSAPWMASPRAAEGRANVVVEAWSRAENRGWCAPLAPGAESAIEDAAARVSRFSGGWAVEYDRDGMPGLGTDGEGCEECGQGVFGIAGTSMSPSDLLTEDDDAALPAPTYRDGSHAHFEVDETIASASLTVTGQGCVYQVWSFLGEAHVRRLVDALRLVVPQPEPTSVASRGPIESL